MASFSGAEVRLFGQPQTVPRHENEMWNSRISRHERRRCFRHWLPLSVVAGILLLVLLILILWKLGFFKRKRPDPTLTGNLEKEKELNGEYIS